MKKLIVLVAAALLVFSGCTAAKVYKVGNASLTSFSAAAATAEKAGKVQVNTDMASVVVDKDGKVVSVVLDIAQNTGTFDAKGALTFDPATAKTLTKKEKGDAYGMKSKSGIKKEWFEQAAAFEKWCVGKTSEQIKALAVDAEGVTTNADLKTSVTIGVSEFVSVVVKAMANAVEVKSVAKVGTASITEISATAAVAATATAAAKVGKVQTDVYYATLSLDKSGKILAIKLDVAQNKGTFNIDGTLAFDPATQAVKTKLEKGAEYGMASKSGIKKEWFEQAAAFEKWCIGKTAVEVKALAVDAEGVTTNADLKTSVTIGVNEFVAVVVKAAAAAVEVK